MRRDRSAARARRALVRRRVEAAVAKSLSSYFLAWRFRLKVRAATVYIGSICIGLMGCRGPRHFLRPITLLLEMRVRISSAPGTAGGDCRKDRGKWRASPCREFLLSCL